MVRVARSALCSAVVLLVSGCGGGYFSPPPPLAQAPAARICPSPITTVAISRPPQMPAVAGTQGFKDPLSELPDMAQTSGCFRVVDADIVKTYQSAQSPDFTLRYGAELSNGEQKQEMSTGNKMLLNGATLGMAGVFMRPDLNDQQNALVTLSVVSNRTGATVFTATGRASGQVSKLTTDGSNALVRAAMIDGFNQLVDGFHPAQAKKLSGHKKKAAHASPPPAAQN